MSAGGRTGLYCGSGLGFGIQDSSRGEEFWMFDELSSLSLLLACGVVLRAQDTPRIWQGVYDGTGRSRKGCVQHHMFAMSRRGPRRQHGAGAQGRSLPEQLGR